MRQLHLFSFAFIWSGPSYIGEFKFSPFYWRAWDAGMGSGLYLLTFGPFHFDHQLLSMG